MRARGNPIVDDKGGIHIGATSIFDVVLDTVTSSDVYAFDKLGGNQQLASMTDRADHPARGVKVSNKFVNALVLPHVFDRFGTARQHMLHSLTPSVRERL